MRFGIEVVPFGPYAEPRRVVELAVTAEDAGWEALSIWDHAHFWGGVADPWVTLAGVAASTERLRLITGVAPVPRYRPHLLARAARTLDALSCGRFTLGVGIGVAEDLDPVGDGADARVRAERTDEALPLVESWYAGQVVEHAGAHYVSTGVQVSPGPVQPQLPIWVGGMSTPALRRAARWHGWFAGCIDESSTVHVGPDRVAEAAARLRELGAGTGFEIAVNGTTEPGGPAPGAGSPAGPAAYATAGATWWFESLFGLRGGHDELLARVRSGPPR